MGSATEVGSALYDLTDDHKAMRDMVRGMVDERVRPRAAEIDQSSEYPRDIYELFAEHDLFALPFEERFGGTGTDALMTALAIEEVAKACASSALMIAVHDLASLPLRLFGTEEQKERYIPRLASGEWTSAFALTEAEAGSDPGGMRTRAVRDGDEWVLTGQKIFITNAGVAQLYAVFAVTDPDAGHSHGISCFLVEADSEGLTVPKLEKKMGIRGSPTGAPVFDEVRVPHENLIGDVDQGFKVAMATLDRSRLGVGAQALGIAQGATDYAVAYAKERRQFAKPISSFQGIQFKLADMEVRNCAGRELLYQACAKLDRGDRDFAKYSSMAKLFCSEAAMHNAVEAVQVLGGYGYTVEYPVERMMRDAKITQIYEGTSEIQRLVISRTLLR